MSTHPAHVVAFSELDEAFFRAGDEISAAHEAELDAPPGPARWWLVLVPAVVIVVAFVVAR